MNVLLIVQVNLYFFLFFNLITQNVAKRILKKYTPKKDEYIIF
jgi:hypothetical protein